MDALQVSVTHLDTGCLVTVAGELDLATVPLLHTRLDDANGAVVIDCRNLTFADSSGIAELLVLANRVVSVALASPSPEIRHLVEILGLIEVLRLVDEPS